MKVIYLLPIIAYLACTQTKVDFKDSTEIKNYLDFKVDSVITIPLDENYETNIYMDPKEKNIAYYFNSKNNLEKINFKSNERSEVKLPSELKKRGISQNNIIQDVASKELYIKLNNGTYYSIKSGNSINKIGELDSDFRFKIFDNKLFLLNHNGKTLQQVKFDNRDVIILDSNLIFIDQMPTREYGDNYYEEKQKISNVLLKSQRPFITKSIKGHFEKDLFIFKSRNGDKSYDATIYKNLLKKIHYKGYSNSLIPLKSEIAMLSYNSIIKQNLFDSNIREAELALDNYNSKQIIQEESGWWIFGKRVYFVHANTEQISLSKLKFDKSVEAVFEDGENCYLKFNNAIKIINKDFLRNSIALIDLNEMMQLEIRYNKDVNNYLNYSFTNVLEQQAKLDSIVRTYQNYLAYSGASNHLRSCHNCFTEAYITSCIQCLKSNDPIPQVLKLSYNNLINLTIIRGNFNETLTLDSLSQRRFANIILDNRVIQTLDSIKAYAVKIHHIETMPIAEDSMELLKIFALDGVYSSGIFCHEGCGGCNSELMISKLKKFKNRYRKFKDIIEFHLLTSDIAYINEDYSNEHKIAFENFISRFPNSYYTIHVMNYLLDFYRHKSEISEDDHAKIEYKKLIALMIKKDPEYCNKMGIN